jgi:amino acid transporter
MSLVNLLFGKPLASDEDRAEKIGTATGVPIFGLDALGSAAYGPEAALTILIPLGAAGIHYIVPISGCIIALLAIVYFSYRQTIEAYPTGGGSYTVAGQNLGRFAGLLAAASLMVDYVLVVAVGISAGVGALVSALPSLQPHTLALCLVILAAISILNLRGVRDVGTAFLLPTYLYLACLFFVIALGLWKTILGGGHPVPVIQPPKLGAAGEAASLWLLLKAFSSGCTAMTGVEAVSNGVTAFREPRTQSARRTLSILIGLLILLLAGVGFLCDAYGIGATEAGKAGYESVLSQLAGAITGKGWFYYVTIGSILLVLALQANTAFADFPRLCHVIALDGYLPRAFANRGRRLVYSHGIYVLIFLSGLLLLLFGGVTDRLIPLFAIGAFLAFTMSQSGMVWHWKRAGGRYSRHSMLINGLGAIATAITTAVVIVSKIGEGAWITLLIIPTLMLLMSGVRAHYRRVDREIAYRGELSVDNLRPPFVVVPIQAWNRVSEKALRFAMTLSPDIVAVYVDSGEEETNLFQMWRSRVGDPVRRAGLTAPELVVLRSPYRYVLAPILKYILELERKHPDRQIAVIVPNLVERRWYQRFMHNQTGELLTTLLLLRGNQRIVIINVPWYLHG